MLRAHRGQNYSLGDVLTPSRPREVPEKISHRGAHHTLPENSLPAFLRAIELGADAIELDVHATSDGIVVIHHDPVLNAPGHGPRRIADLRSDELSQYPLGQGIPVPTLGAVFDAVGRDTMI